MYPLNIYKVKISTNYEKLMIKFVVLSVALGTILSFVREITHAKKTCKKNNKNTSFCRV